MLTDLQKRKLMKLFSMYDADFDGSLVGKDFEAVAHKLAEMAGWSTRSPKCLTLMGQFTQEWKRLKGSADADHDQKISIDEWFTYYDGVLSDEQKYNKRVQTLKELVFDVFDVNGDGELSAAEWSKLLSVYNVSPVYVSIIFPILDIDQDGVLKKPDVIALMREFFYSDDPDAPGNLVFGPY